MVISQLVIKQFFTVRFIHIDFSKFKIRKKAKKEGCYNMCRWCYRIIDAMICKRNFLSANKIKVTRARELHKSKDCRIEFR